MQNFRILHANYVTIITVFLDQYHPLHFSSYIISRFENKKLFVMKTIIAPTDFSPVSVNSCLFAAKLAEDIKADLLLFHTMELPIAVAEYPVTEDVFDEEGMEKELQALKNKLAAATNNKIKIKTKNILGSPEYEIKELTKTAKPFAVVMGTHSYSTLDRLFLGSTTAYTAKHLNYPVIVVPQNASYKAIKKIALASDLKNVYDLPASEIEMIVKLFNAELEIFYAGKNENVINKNAIGNVMLDHRLVRLDPKFYTVEDEDTLRGISALAEKNAIDMLIVTAKKHGPFHKSQSREFVFYSSVPVMIIHENDLQTGNK